MSFNGCACQDGLGHGIMNEEAWVQFLPDDPEPGPEEGDINTGDAWEAFTYGTTGLGGVVLSDIRKRRRSSGLGFSFSDLTGGGGGDLTGGGGFGPGITLGGSGGITCPDGSVVPDDFTECPGYSPGGGSGPVALPPTVGPQPPSSGGPDWSTIIGSLSKLGVGIAQAVSGPQYPQGGYRITGYTPQGQPIYGGVSGGVALTPGGVSGQLGISTNTLVIGALVVFALMMGKK